MAAPSNSQALATIEGRWWSKQRGRYIIILLIPFLWLWFLLYYIANDPELVAAKFCLLNKICSNCPLYAMHICSDSPWSPVPTWATCRRSWRSTASSPSKRRSNTSAGAYHSCFLSSTVGLLVNLGFPLLFYPASYLILTYEAFLCFFYSSSYKVLHILY